MLVETGGILIPILLFIILLLLAAVAWLYFRKPTPPSGGNGDDQPEERLVNRHYAQDQVIIGGSSANIDQAIDAVQAELQILLREIVYETAVPEEHSEEYAKKPPTTYVVRRAVFAQPAGTGDDFQFRHYRVVSNQGEHTMPKIEQALTRQNVCASANYAIGRAVNMLQGDPGSGEGFPGSGEGFSAGATGGHAVKKDFYNQWGLHAPSLADGMGINLYKKRFNGNDETADDILDTFFKSERTVTATGNGCRIVIFDSSPYDDPIEKHQDIASPFIHKVVHNELRGFPDARDHGLFVASLAHVVAPESTIHLYRVLSDSNRGSLTTLIDNICAAINEYKQDTRKDNLCGLVLNLSMGIHVEESLRQAVLSGIRQESDLAPALYCLLKKAHDKGAIIIAATGNDSAQQANPKPAQLPAFYSFVISVEAGNFNGNRSCFSNSGDVRAPGGDNKLNAGDDCTVKPYESLSFDERKKSSVIGFVKEISPNTRHAFWRGTSFAAPLVSGLAALLLGLQISKEKCDPRLVEEIIKGTSATESMPRDGRPPVINVLEAVKRLES